MSEIVSLASKVTELVRTCHCEARQRGWHENPREDCTFLMLIVSELAECMEGLRSDLMDNHLTRRPMAEVELADALIRICDFAGLKGYDLGGAVVEKLLYNRARADHEPTTRRKKF